MKKKNYFVSDFVFKPEHGEKVSTKPSMTVPDETLSLKQILERYSRTRQIDPRLERAASYDSGAGFDSIDLSKVKDLDPFEREELLMDVEQEIKVRQAFLEEQKKAKESERKRASERRDDDEGVSGTKKPVVKSDEREGGTTTSKEHAKTGEKGQKPSSEKGPE